MSVTNHGRQHNRERETEPYGQHLCRHTPCLSGTPRSIQQPCYTTALKELNNAEEPLLKHWFSHSFTFSYNFNTMVWNWAIWGGKKTMYFCLNTLKEPTIRAAYENKGRKRKKKAINNRCWFTSHVRQQQKRVPFLLSSKTEHLQTSPTTCHQEKKTRRTWKQKRTQSKEKRQNTQVRTA